MISTSAENHVVAAELELLDPAVRGDRSRVERLLDPSFTEIGASGRLWTRDESVTELSATARSAGLQAGRMSQTHTREIAPGLVLLTYLLDLDSGRSRRSSVWQIDGDRTRAVFHQGTPVSD